jgi:hypothetical protein
MTFSVWILVLAVFLSGAVAGVFVVLVIGIRTGDRGHHITDEPDTRLEALTRSVLGVGVRTDFAVRNKTPGSDQRPHGRSRVGGEYLGDLGHRGGGARPAPGPTGGITAPSRSPARPSDQPVRRA